MTRLRLLALLTLTIAALATSAGCGDNVDDLAAARAARKPVANKAAGTGDASVIPVSNTGTTLPLPNSGTAAGACAPEQVGALDVQWRPPHARQQACTAQEANILASCFFANQGCDQQVSALCHQCAVSSSVASSTYGAIIVDESGQRQAEPNVEGCVAAMTGDVSATGCGARLRAKFGCESQACDKCDDTTHDACVTAADTGVCASYSQAAASCMGSLTQCIQGTTPVAVALNLVQMFCM